MLCKLIADFLVVLHFSFILFVVLGGLLAFKCRYWLVLHLPAVVWAVLLEFNGWLCPLTVWENHFRQSAEQTGYEGGFIEHYLLPVIYPAGLTGDIQILLGAGVLSLNVLIYSYILKSIFCK